MFLFLVLCYNTATGWQPICSWINIIIIIIIIIREGSSVAFVLQRMNDEH